MVDRLIRILPVKAWQDFLIRRHVSGCAACMGMLAAEEEVRAVMIQEQDLLGIKDFWPEVKLQLLEGPRIPVRSLKPLWQWVSVTAALAVMVITSFWLYKDFGREETAGGGQRLLIDYVKIEDKPARAYVYKPQGVDMTLVWVEKNGEGE